MRPLGQRKDDALVLDRRQLGRGIDEQEIDGAQNHAAHHEGDGAQIEGGGQAAAVPGSEPAEGAVDETGESGVLASLFQEDGAHHRRQRQRDNAGNDDGAGQGKGELAKERAGQPRQKADGRIDGGERDGHGDDGADDFPRADDGGLDRRFAVLDVPVDVFHHDDGVVHDKPDGEHHGEKRQQIDGESERQHDDAGADQ